MDCLFRNKRSVRKKSVNLFYTRAPMKLFLKSSKYFSLSLLFLNISCTKPGRHSPEVKVTPPAPSGTSAPLPGPTADDDIYLGLAGNCVSGKTSANELIKDEKLLNSLTELIARPQEERAQRLSASAKNNNWTCPQKL